MYALPALKYVLLTSKIAHLLLGVQVTYRLFYYDVDGRFQAKKLIVASEDIKTRAMQAIASSEGMNIKVLARHSMDQKGLAAQISIEILKNIAWCFMQPVRPQVSILEVAIAPLMLILIEVSRVSSKSCHNLSLL